MPTISQSAKARGQTGFLKPIRNYEITASGPKCADSFATNNKREALRQFHRLVKYTADHGRYHGAKIVLECDGVEIEAHG